jgi:nitrate/nitrite transporter NarK
VYFIFVLLGNASLLQFLLPIHRQKTGQKSFICTAKARFGGAVLPSVNGFGKNSTLRWRC